MATVKTALTKRQAIEKLRHDLREFSADTRYTNQYLYQSLVIHAKWLTKREVYLGRIYRNASLFQVAPCVEVIETTTSEQCCPVKTNCKIYRTKDRLPDMWEDYDGPIIKSVMSVDRSTSFQLISANKWINKKDDPYKKFSSEKYVFFSDGYLWFPEHNPHRILVEGMYVDDMDKMDAKCDGCENKNEGDCNKYLDGHFNVPDWLEGELFAKALEQLVGVTKRLPEDNQIDKNEARKN